MNNERNKILKYLKEKRGEPVKDIDFITEIYYFIRLLCENNINGITINIKESLINVILNIAYSETINPVYQTTYFIDIAKKSFSDIEEELLHNNLHNYISEKHIHEICKKINTIKKMIDNLKNQIT